MDEEHDDEHDDASVASSVHRLRVDFGETGVPNGFAGTSRLRGGDRNYYSALLAECREPALHAGHGDVIRLCIGSIYHKFETVIKIGKDGSVVFHVVEICLWRKDSQAHVRSPNGKRKIFHLYKSSHATLKEDEWARIRSLASDFLTNSVRSPNPICEMKLGKDYRRNGYQSLVDIACVGGQCSEIYYRPFDAQLPGDPLCQFGQYILEVMQKTFFLIRWGNSPPICAWS